MKEAWLSRWRQGRIGFHREWPHPALIEYWPSLAIVPGTKVLVPLCGKSLDMRWLSSRGYPVLGVELSLEAIDQFARQADAETLRYRQDGFEVYRQGNIELWGGDFFHFHIQQAADVEAFYDRAALIALPEAARHRYAFHLAQLLPPGAKGLLISLIRPSDDEGGPPYSVSAGEVDWLFSANFELTHLADGEPEENGWQESVWALVRRGPGRSSSAR